MSLSSVVFPIVFIETITEINVHSYISAELFSAEVFCSLGGLFVCLFACLILTFSWCLLDTLDTATLPISYWCPSFFFVAGNIVKILLVSD